MDVLKIVAIYPKYNVFACAAVSRQGSQKYAVLSART